MYCTYILVQCIAYLRCPEEKGSHDGEFPDCSPQQGPWGPTSWLSRAAVEANDRWWETLLAATCYWEVEPRQQSEIKFKTFTLRFSPSDETIWAKQLERSARMQYRTEAHG